jgi:hypothetical protein
MKGRLLLLAGAAAGYVMGTRAGRQRYEQIKGRVQSIWNDPKVQQKITEAQDTVMDKAPEVQHKLADAASTVADKAKSTVQRDHDTETKTDTDTKTDTTTDMSEVGTHARNGHVPRSG